MFTASIVSLNILFATVTSAGCVLRTIGEALRIPGTPTSAPCDFDFTGVVLSHNETGTSIRDPNGDAITVSAHPDCSSFVRGNTVRIIGEITRGATGIRVFKVDSAKLISKGHPIEPVETSVADVNNGRADFHLVRLNGIISSVTPDEIDTRYCWARLRTASGDVFLTFSGKWNNPELLGSFVDAEVTITGLSVPIGGFRQKLGHSIALDNEDTVTVLKSSPSDPFAVPTLLHANTPHKQKVCGRVCASEARRFFIVTPARQFITVTTTLSAKTELPSPDDLVTVSGFVSADPYHTLMTDALVRIDGHTTNKMEILSRSIRSLHETEKGIRRIDSSVDGKLICIQGRTSVISHDEMLVSDGTYAVTLNIKTLQHLGISTLDDNSEISVKGLCLCEFENSTTSIYPTFKRFTIIPRATSDIRVVASPPWWTPFRLLVLVLALLAVIAVSLAWNVMLKRKSEKRGKELYEEKIDHALAEQKVEERTRLAVELHDSVSQTLTGVALQLDGGEVETAKTMLASCRGELRRCLWDLRSRTFEEKDMTEAVTRTITPHLNGAEATVRFNVPRERLSESLTHAILRIIRELVVNAIRHGQTKHIRIAGEMHENTVSFSVADNGRGFDPKAAPGPEQGHFGLLGIRERIEDFNGTLKIASAPGKGAKFTVTLLTTDETNEQ